MKRIKFYLLLLLCMVMACQSVLASSQQCQVITLAEDRPTATHLYLLDAGRPGPTLVFVAGTHGNEQAGYLAAEWMLDNLQVKTGRVAIVPQANAQAVSRQVRTSLDGTDLNRLFPGTTDGNDIETLAYQLVQEILALQPVAVIDMHEGRNLYGKDGSIGNSLVIGNTAGSFLAALDVLEVVNAKIEPLTPFTYDANAPEGSLNHHLSRVVGIDSFTIETPQIYDLPVRVHQQLLFVKAFMDYYGLEANLDLDTLPTLPTDFCITPRNAL